MRAGTHRLYGLRKDSVNFAARAEVVLKALRYEKQIRIARHCVLAAGDTLE